MPEEQKNLVEKTTPIIDKTDDYIKSVESILLHDHGTTVPELLARSMAENPHKAQDFFAQIVKNENANKAREALIKSVPELPDAYLIKVGDSKYKKPVKVLEATVVPEEDIEHVESDSTAK